MKLDLSKRLVRWSIKLSEFDLKFYPRTTIQAQALADFIVEQTQEEQMQNQAEEELKEWIIDVDRSSNKKGNCAGLILIGLDRQRVEYALRL